MIGDATLRIIIGADALGAIARTDHALAGIGAFGIGFVVAGFAIAHHRTRGKPARGLMLWTAYLATVIFTLPLAFFLFLGLFDTARTLTVTGSGPTSKP